MKKEIKENKLSLTKMTIAKLTDSHMIRGGNETNQTDTTQDPADYEPKCINNSKDIILVKKKEI